jgi:hypothetical protein
VTDSTSWLLALLLFSHFLGDFTPLASRRVQEAKAVGKPIGPIAAHALIHAALVGITVMLVVRPQVVLLATAMGIQFTTHFGIDWIRGLLGARHPTLSDPKAQAFWTILGLDQLAHGLVLIWITLYVL